MPSFVGPSWTSVRLRKRSLIQVGHACQYISGDVGQRYSGVFCSCSLVVSTVTFCSHHSGFSGLHCSPCRLHPCSAKGLRSHVPIGQYGTAGPPRYYGFASFSGYTIVFPYGAALGHTRVFKYIFYSRAAFHPFAVSPSVFPWVRTASVPFVLAVVQLSRFTCTESPQFASFF